MKIPETTVNVGAYYGNEENGQWQPNGVIIDNGVGGGVVGSGDAGIHRGPVYPVHIPRAQVPAGYVVAGAYYPPAGYPPVAQQPPDDFADYMWMEHEEEFDKQVMQQLEEEALMEQCIEAMLEDEQRERHNRPMANGHKRNHNHYPTTSNGGPSVSLEEAVSKSTLNPLAAEFYPTRVRPVPAPAAPQPHTDERQESTSAPTEEVQQTREEQPQPASAEVTVEPKTEVTTEPRTDEVLPSKKDPPEVSAADVQPIPDKVQEKRPPRDIKKDTAQTKPRIDNKPKTTKTEVRRTKPLAAKSETIVAPIKKEVKTIRSETKVEVRDSEKVKEADKVKSEVESVRSEVKVEKELPPVVVAEIPKVQPSQPEDQQPSTGFKPINYAAAAKSNKPKKPSPPPTAAEKPTPPPSAPPKTKPAEKKDKRPEKVPSKDKPVVQRKNSVK